MVLVGVGIAVGVVVGVTVGVGVSVAVPVGVAVGTGPVMVRIPVALVADCPSGLVIVIVREPGAAPGATVMLRRTVVGFVNVTSFTVTPPPFTTAARWFGKLESGS